MLDAFVGKDVVIDLSSPFVCMGRLRAVSEHFLELHEADLHDLRDSKSTRENYVVAALATGIKRNRKRVLVSRRDIVAVAALRDVVVE